ncbi:MAG: carbamoyl phosphate synthase large subunit, partial [Duncaniella sp.]|nr:carbamoyl phosphate synthase large subunit [Duncaniella sp.]
PKSNLIDLATRVMLGLDGEKPHKNAFDLDYVGIKASQFSFSRLQGADPVLGVDMASTGEVGCIGTDSADALIKAMISVGNRVPSKAILMSTGTPKQKADLLDAAHELANRGYTIYATGGTHTYLNDNGIPAIRVYWPSQSDMQPQAIELLHDHKVDMVINIPKNFTDTELSNGYKIRRAAIDLNIPLLTNARLASAYIDAFTSHPLDDIEIKSWDEY